MKGNGYKLEEFKSYLLKDNKQEKDVLDYLQAITGFLKFLETRNETIFSFSYGKLIEYADALVTKDKEAARYLIIGLWRYFPFIGKHEYVEELLDIAESAPAMDTLYKRLAEWHGEGIRDEIFKNIVIPPLGVHPETKPPVTQVVMKRLEEKLGEEKTIELLRPCLHGGPPAESDKKKFYELNDLDKFLQVKHQDFINEVESHRDNGTAMFAQLVDDEVVEYVKTIPSMGPGIRDKNQIIISKVPYQIKRFLKADTNALKRYYLCYCPWVRGAMKKGTEKEISRNFCYCSGGYYKLYWDEIFEQPIKVEPVETALWGDLICKFVIEIPDNIMQKFVHEN